MAMGLGAEPSGVRIEKLSPQLGDDRSEREPDSGFFLGSVSGMRRSTRGSVYVCAF